MLNHLSRLWRTAVSAGLLSLVGAMVSPMAWAEGFSDGWGPTLQSPMPVLAAPDQSGAARTLENLTGEQGLLLFLNRSADW